MNPPTPSTEESMYRRVLLVSRLDGLSILIVATFGTFLALILGDLVGVLVGALIIGAGTMELRGHKALKQRDSRGMRWLVRSQLLLLTVILVYCASRLGSFDGEGAMGNMTPEMSAALQEAGLEIGDVAPLVRTLFFALYGSVAVVTILYQGGMAYYYSRRVARVTAFLTPPPAPVNYSVL